MTPLKKVGMTVLMVLMGALPALTLFVDPLPDSRPEGAPAPGDVQAPDDGDTDKPTTGLDDPQQEPPDGDQTRDDAEGGSKERAPRAGDRADRGGLGIRIGFGGDPDGEAAPGNE